MGSLGQKLCLWHPKHFCLGWTSLARQLSPIAGLWGLVEVVRRVWDGRRRSAWSERVPLPSPCLCQKFGVSRSKTLSSASKTVLPTSSRRSAPMAFLLGPIGVHHRTRRRLSDGTSALQNVVGMHSDPPCYLAQLKDRRSSFCAPKGPFRPICPIFGFRSKTGR